MTIDFNQRYLVVEHPAMRRAEVQVIGCDYGATSFTTREQADELVRRLDLGPGDTLLDIGSGAGWPGLYLSRTTGCRSVLTDLSHEGIQVALRRIRLDGMSTPAVTASAQRLPFPDMTFDVITHSDVLCCLPEKQTALDESRRVLRSDGRLLFFVIELADGLSGTSRDEAIASAPDHVAAPAPYLDLVSNARFTVIEQTDVTDGYYETLRAWLHEWDIASSDLVPLLGKVEFEERQQRRRNGLAAVENGWIRRTAILATTVLRGSRSPRFRRYPRPRDRSTGAGCW